MRIGELAAMAGCTPRAIRHYHREGVLPEPARDPNGYRRYELADLERLVRLRWLLSCGLTLEDAARLDRGPGVSGRVEQTLRQALAGIEARRALLDRQQQLLESLLDGRGDDGGVAPLDATVTSALSTLADDLGPSTRTLLTLERSSIELLAHRRVVGVRSQRILAESYESAASDPASRVRMEAVGRRWEALAGVDPASADGVGLVDELASAMIALASDSGVEAFTQSLDPSDGPGGGGDEDAWLEAMFPDRAHRAVMERVLEELRREGILP